MTIYSTKLHPVYNYPYSHNTVLAADNDLAAAQAGCFTFYLPITPLRVQSGRGKQIAGLRDEG